jgi:hypothetical protein
VPQQLFLASIGNKITQQPMAASSLMENELAQRTHMQAGAERYIHYYIAAEEN